MGIIYVKGTYVIKKCRSSTQKLRTLKPNNSQFFITILFLYNFLKTILYNSQSWRLSWKVNSNESKAVTISKSVSHTRLLPPVRSMRGARLRLSSQSANLFQSRSACSTKSCCLNVHLSGQLRQLEKLWLVLELITCTACSLRKMSSHTGR